MIYDGEKDINQTWETWRRYVIESIKKLNQEVDEIKKEESNQRVENAKQFTKLNTSATIYGVIGGTIISLLITIFSGFMIYHITSGAEKDNPTHIEQQNIDNK